MEDRPRKTALTFTIGLTGHRDLDPRYEPELRDALKRELGAIQARFKSLQVELLTGLAEGADTLATQVALEIGMPVRAVLPMPRALYEDDFAGKALDEFRALSNDPRLTIEEIPLPVGADLAGVMEGAARDALYARLMDYLVRRSNVLVALWDGEATGLTGGSSDVVLTYLLGTGLFEAETDSLTLASDAALVDPTGDLVVWIKAPRQSGNASGSGGEIAYLFGAGGRYALTCLSQLTSEVVRRWEQFDDYHHLRSSAVGVGEPAYPLSDQGDEVISTITPSIDQEYLRADQLALANQRNSDRLFKLFGVMAALMGLAFLIYAKIAATKLFLIAYILLFAFGFALFAIGSRRRWFSRHLAFRALAETLRTRFFLVLSGAGQAVSSERVLRLSKIERFDGFAWLRDVVRSTEPLTYESAEPASTRVAATRERWVNDQAAYFQRKHHQLHAQHERLELVKKLLFLLSFLGALSLLLFKDTLYHFHLADLDGKTLVVFLMGLLPLWLAIWELYQSKMATRELLWQYASQSDLFELAQARLSSTADAQVARDIISDLAEQSLMEVYQWTTHRYHRDHEPPSAG